MSWFSLRLPDLVAGLPSDVREGERAFDGRVKERFPMGTSEDAVKAELQKQGFDLLPAYDGVQDATFFRKRVPFTTLWSVRWKANSGRLTDVWGVYGIRGP